MTMEQRIRVAHETLIGMMDELHFVPKEVAENKFGKKMIRWLLLDEYITPIGEMYEVFVYPKPEELNSDSCREFGCAIALQAAKDFFDDYKGSDGVLNMLRSPYMEFITNGLSVALAKTLKENPNQVKAVVMQGGNE